MRKYIATIVFFLIGFVLVLPSIAKADVSGHDNATFDADTQLYLSGLGLYLTVSSGSEVNEIAIGANQLTVKLLQGSFITITSPDKKILTNDLVTTTCGTSNSSLTISTSTTSGFTSVDALTITPSGDCTPGTSGGGGGGGGGATTAAEAVTEEETTTEEVAEEEVVEEEAATEEEQPAEEVPVSQMTIEQLREKIVEIQAKIQMLLVELAKLRGETGIAGIPSTFSFTRNLQLGITGEDVKYLQIVLNSDPDTQLASTGVGSPGNETTYFGPITKSAVIKFQEKYAKEVLAPWGFTAGTGYVAKTTRAKLNSLLGR